jgi:hypothetical protein
MTAITRRVMLRHSAATAALAVAGGSLMPAPLSASRSAAPAALFVFDARFARSAMLADSHREAGAILLDPRDADLGIAWRSLIPPLLQEGRRIAGLTLWSDRMICEIFARDAKATFSSQEISAGDRADTRLHHWELM